MFLLPLQFPCKNAQHNEIKYINILFLVKIGIKLVKIQKPNSLFNTKPLVEQDNRYAISATSVS